APMMECKKALTEAGGDEAKAIEILREQFKKVQLKRADNATEEGRIFIALAADGSEAAMVEVQCESAPVATGDVLKTFGDGLANWLLNGPGAATPEELMAQTPAGASASFQAEYEEMVNKIREKIVVNRIARVKGPLGSYVHHDFKTGVLFQATGEGANKDVLRDVAMHIAALKPTCATEDGVDPAAVAAERERLTEEAKASGKPDNIIGKIVDGRMKVFYVEQGVLVYQPFAKDDSKTVGQALSEAGFAVGSFLSWRVGAAN
ncbi:MAG: translation elongation factor Ts, partial [Planctomycetaceae bacterium]|nr:translation elongation factor Ts [Planctomycetaceae bacterium]